RIDGCGARLIGLRGSIRVQTQNLSVWRRAIAATLHVSAGVQRGVELRVRAEPERGCRLRRSPDAVEQHDAIGQRVRGLTKAGEAERTRTGARGRCVDREHEPRALELRVQS